MIRVLLRLSLVVVAASALAQSPADFALVRARLRASQTGGDALDTTDPVLAAKVQALTGTAQTHWNNLNKSATRTALWPDLPVSPTASDSITPVFERLKTLAAAYAANGGALRGNTLLRDDLVAALQFLNTTTYGTTRPYYDNWFPWHLGVPLNVVDIFACLHDGLAPASRGPLYAAYAAAIDQYQATAGATFAGTGANRIWRSRIDVGLGAALESPARLLAGRDKLSVVLPYVSSGDGFYPDGSFIQHNIHSYTGGYGLYLISDLAAVLEAVADTPWSVNDPNLANVFRWVDDAYDPVLYRGAIMDLTRGREIARAGSTDHASGHPTLTALARIARFAAPADALRFRALVKGHVQSDAFRNFTSNAGLAAAALVKPILDDPAVPARPARTGCFVFAGMDRIVHQRGGWAYAVSLSSKRIAKYESINLENLRGWHLGDGAAYVYTGDLAQYADQYWPTVNPYRLAGTTVDSRPRADAGTSSPNTIDPRTTKAWVGGSTVLGEFGAGGLDHEAALSDLRAKKSWFFFDQEVVHLGAGIVTSPENPNRIETIVENRLVGGAGNAGPAVLSVNGAAFSAAGTVETLPSVRHAHLAVPTQSGYGNADIGYVFPGAPTLQALRESRTGRYTDISRGPFTSSTPQTRNYVTLWFDHGARLTGPGESYAYIVLPGLSAAQTAAYAASPAVEILANTAAVQAVHNRSLKATGINFWTATSVAGFSCTAPASLSCIERGGQLHLGLADPTQELGGPVIAELPYAAERATALDPAIIVLALAPKVRLQFAVGGSRGRSLSASLQLAVDPDRPPIIDAEPADLTMPAGATVALTVSASAKPAAGYQWLRNGMPLPGETAAALLLRQVGAPDVAAYSCLVTNSLGSATSRPARLTLAAAGGPETRLANLSVRSLTGPGSQTLIVGFVVGGAGSPALLIRGLGPSLIPFGVTDALADPFLTLFSGSSAAASNNDWAGNSEISAAAAAAGAFAFAGTDSKDAALYRSGLSPGAYTVQVAGSGAATGVALAEIYDVTPPAAGGGPRLVNLAARTIAGSGQETLIVGFVLSGRFPQTVLIRAIGPGLAAFGVTGNLADPALGLYRGSDRLLGNDDWGGSPAIAQLATQSGAFPLGPTSRDAALATTLAPGAYTVQVGGAGGGAGITLVEVYAVP